MKSFNESFYTEDYDQEMLDFIETNYTVDHDVSGWSNLNLSLCYSDWDSDFYLAYNSSEGNKLTKEEFKQKIGMPTEETEMGEETLQEQATFGKKDLVDGMFIKCRDECLYLKLGNSCYNLTCLLELSSYTDNLLDIEEERDLDIIEVFIKQEHCYFSLSHMLDQGIGMQSIWKRTPPKSEKVIKLEERISTMQDYLLALKEQLEEELTL